jgi:hypothetical protein
MERQLNIPETSDEDERGRELANALDFLTIDDVCALYKITPGTADAWRKRRKGPEHIVAGAATLYPRSGVVADLEARLARRQQQSGKGVL